LSKISVLYMGTPDFAVAPLEGLLAMPEVTVSAVITQPDKPAGRGHKLLAPPVKALALEHQLTVLQPDSLKKDLVTVKQQLRSLGPFDVGVVCAYGQILPAELLSFPDKGCINIHASILPRWRGAAPIQRAIMAGDTQSGISLMKMDQGLDTGDVFSTHSIDISPLQSAGELHDQLALVGKEAIKSDLMRIIKGELPAMPQSDQGVTYAKKIANDECLIDWGLSASTIQRQILGLSPFPGAFSFLGDKRVKIYYAEAKGALSATSRAVPGEIIMAEGARLEVQCGTGCIALDQIQIEGKKRMPVAQFLCGMDISIGMKFKVTPQS